MKSHFEHDTQPGQTSAREASGHPQSSAARIAAITQRDERRREAEYRRRNFLVTHGEVERDLYQIVSRFDLFGIVLDEAEPTSHFTIDDVVADIVRRFDRPSEYDPNYDMHEQGGFAGEDVAVWRDGKIMAIVRRGADGGPEATRFDHDAGSATEGDVTTTDGPPDPVLAKLLEIKRLNVEIKRLIVENKLQIAVILRRLNEIAVAQRS